MSDYYLAIDIGASSGRHMLGSYKEGQLILEEIHRFSNGMTEKDGQLCWDYDHLFDHILEGMKKCKNAGKVPVSMGIDTWAVDFVLLDTNDTILGETLAYRDSRTDGMDSKVYEVIDEQSLYRKTGIQKQPFNTIYQLMAIKEETPEIMTAAENFLMVPDYFHYLLTGVKRNEYSNATTTQLVSPLTCEWDMEMIEALGYKSRMFCELAEPGTAIGTLTAEIIEQVGFDCEVVLPGTHDTASAVVSVPAEEDHVLYISSGTWSLMGTELASADCSEESAR